MRFFSWIVCTRVSWERGEAKYHIIEQGLSPYHLLCSHANGLDSKLSCTHVEEVLQTGAQEVNHENVVEALLSNVVDLRNSSYGV